MRYFFYHLLSRVWPAILGLTLTGCQTTRPTAQIYRIRVEAGDTLAAIARKYDTSWERIATLNALPAGRPLVIGAILRVAPGPGGLVATSVGEGDGEDDGESAAMAAEGNASAGGGLLFGGNAELKPGSLEWPIYGSLSSQYGMRHGRFHHGIDIRVKTGSPVLAAAPGIVEFAGRQHGYGQVVIIRHKNIKTLYGHLGTVSVKAGQAVTGHSALGSSGKSGNSTGPHLHFEIRDLKNRSVDPLTLIAKDKLLTARN